MLFLSFVFAKLGAIREIHGNRSPWFEVVDIDNGMHLFTIRVIIFHCSILPVYPAEVGSVFFFYSKVFKVLRKCFKDLFSNKISSVIKKLFSARKTLEIAEGYVFM